MDEVVNYLNMVRREYSGKDLDTSIVDSDPFVQLSLWMEDAVAASVKDPSAMVLSTCGDDGLPNARVVALRGYVPGGIVFYTNYDSEKSKELIQNPNAAVTFFWVELDRQIRMKVSAEKTSRKMSEDYFKSRPVESQLSAIASQQSKVVDSRKVLEDQVNDAKSKEIECPNNWGGFILIPKEIEFWQGRPSRLHDRIKYSRIKDEWKIERLAP